MQAANFERTVEALIQRDPRYQREAYEFVREALDYTQKAVAQRVSPDAVRHVTGQELLEGIRDYALQTFGPMAMLVLNDWGINACEDFGEIVFNMVECGLLAKTDQDKREDFRGGYSFEDAFRKPYLPRNKPSLGSVIPKPTSQQN
jgi:uncharacterized repeat protein (TIGR04138 family)